MGKVDTKVDNANVDQRPIDILVDIIVGLLEQSTSFSKIVAIQSFSYLSSLVTESAIDLILAVCQLLLCNAQPI
jgi:hypothetical protein